MVGPEVRPIACGWRYMPGDEVRDARGRTSVRTRHEYVEPMFRDGRRRRASYNRVDRPGFEIRTGAEAEAVEVWKETSRRSRQLPAKDPSSSSEEQSKAGERDHPRCQSGRHYRYCVVEARGASPTEQDSGAT